MHLNMAYKMVDESEFLADSLDLIHSYWPAFCLGNIAADFQQICDVKRGRTHLYSTPPESGDHEAFARLLLKYPELADTNGLGAERAVFYAGYGAHLIYDLVWYHNIVTIFTEGDWTDQIGRYIAHSTLLAFEDQRSLQKLPDGLGEILLDIDPTGWLPFDPGDHLVTWQKLVAEQLFPGAEVQTVPIFAKRMRMTAEQLTDRLADEAWMQNEVFNHAPLDLVDRVLQESIDRAITQAVKYLNGQ